MGLHSRGKFRRSSSGELDARVDALLRRSSERSRPATLWAEAGALLTGGLNAKPYSIQLDSTDWVSSYPPYVPGKLNLAPHSSSRAQSPHSIDRLAGSPHSSSTLDSSAYTIPRPRPDNGIQAASPRPGSAEGIRTPNLSSGAQLPYSSKQNRHSSHAKFLAAMERLASPPSSIGRSPGRPLTAGSPTALHGSNWAGSSTALQDSSWAHGSTALHDRRWATGDGGDSWVNSHYQQASPPCNLGQQLEHGERLLQLHGQLDALTQQLHSSQQAVVSVAEQNRQLRQELSSVQHGELQPAAGTTALDALARRNKKLSARLRRVLDVPEAGTRASGEWGAGAESTMLQPLQDDRRRLQSQVESLLSSQKHMQAELQVLRSGLPPEISRTLRELEEQRRAADEQNVVVADQESTIQELKAVTKELMQQCESLRGAAGHSESQLSELNAKCSRLHESEAEARSLREQLRRASERESARDAGTARAVNAECEMLRQEVELGAQQRRALMQRLMDANVHISELHAELGPRLLRSPSPHSAGHTSTTLTANGGDTGTGCEVLKGQLAQESGKHAAAAGPAAASDGADCEGELRELARELLKGVAGAAGAAAAPQVDAMGMPALLAMLRRGVQLLASKTPEPKLSQAKAEAENEAMRVELGTLAKKHVALMRQFKAAGGAVPQGAEGQGQRELAALQAQHEELKSAAAKTLNELKEALAGEKQECERLRQELAQLTQGQQQQQQQQQQQMQMQLGGAIAAAMSAREADAAHGTHPPRPHSRPGHVSWGGAAIDEHEGPDDASPRAFSPRHSMLRHHSTPNAFQFSDGGADAAAREGSEIGSPRSTPPPAPFGEQSSSAGALAQEPSRVSPRQGTDRAALVAAVLQSRQQQQSPSPRISNEPSMGGGVPSDRAALVAAVLNRQQSVMAGRSGAASKQASLASQRGLAQQEPSGLQSGVSVARLSSGGAPAGSDRAALVAAVLQKQQSMKIKGASGTTTPRN